MKNTFKIKTALKKLLLVVTCLFFTATGYAADMDHSSHEKPVQLSTIGDYTFSYKLIDMREKLKAMPEMEATKATHHLMVFIKMKHDTREMDITSAKVGYSVQSPDGTKTTAMAMAMGGGFGADVNLGTKGDYIIRTKLINGDTKLIDEFNYSVK
jgi:hypothetical protein